MSKQIRTPGVLGGMGPDATIDFMSRVLVLSKAATDQEHVRLLVDQNPHVPDRQAALLRAGENPGPVLADMACRLEAGGADFLVMPCNTAHAYQSYIVEAVDIPFVSIVDTTVSAIPATECAGLLATRGCVDANVFQPVLDSAGIDYRVLDKAQADALTDLMFDVKSGNRGADVVTGMRRLAAELVSAGAGVLVAACTEIPLVLAPGDAGVPLLSSTDELAKATIALARGDAALPE